MRNGDVYKIKSMVLNGATDKDIVERFKNDYPKSEIKDFIVRPLTPSQKAVATKKANAAKKADPLA